MNAIDIRTKFLQYFALHGHKVISSSSVIPENDPSVLFTTAGMHPLVPFLLGEPHPQGKCLVDYQKCIRTDDIEEVGDDIHLTFFEMLGNWSLGDYFKEDAIKMSYDFLINELHLDIDRIAVTVFEGDDDAPKDIEAMTVWKRVGIKESNIFYFGKKHNWWGPAGQTGPCGPDTEIFFDTLKPKCSEGCNPTCGCGKYWEIWNNVFMQYNKEKDGTFTSLNQKNVDTGMGLERITAIIEGKSSIFETELFSSVVEVIKSLVNVYDEKSIRIIADHIRASCFIISDGIKPSNVDQGYVLRRLIRRVIRHMRKVGIDPELITELINTTIGSLNDMYPELENNKEVVIYSIVEEKNKFLITIYNGEKKFNKIIEESKRVSNSIIDANTVFQLYDTFGFPPEITNELVIENGMTADIKGFEELYKQHQELSRKSAVQKFKGGLADNTIETSALHTATHLLHKALQIVLGEHAKQKGSNITNERLRFDFSHNQKLTTEEIQKVEDIVNNTIRQELPIICVDMPYQMAIEKGAEGLFINKYEEIVKVYSIGEFSIEICGGPHVSNTSKLGCFKVLKEESVASGVRRIKAILC